MGFWCFSSSVFQSPGLYEEEKPSVVASITLPVLQQTQFVTRNNNVVSDKHQEMEVVPTSKIWIVFGYYLNHLLIGININHSKICILVLICCYLVHFFLKLIEIQVCMSREKYVVNEYTRNVKTGFIVFCCVQRTIRAQEIG